MNAILNKVFPEGYRKLVVTAIVLAIGLGIYFAHGSLPDEVVKLLLGGLGIFAGGNVGEWIARALGDLETPKGFSAARDEVEKAVMAAVPQAVAPVVPPQAVSAAKQGMAAASFVAASLDQHNQLVQRVEGALATLSQDINQIADVQKKQGNAIGGIVQIINGKQPNNAAPMQAGAAPLSEG
ncbi:MAG: hypothetical protein NVS9B9_08630 [Ktedonobacteraceae bacterium]